MATIRDIAKLAKVSASTVSRVINDDPRISGKTKKSKKIIEEMHYIPNSMAKQLVMKTSFSIGFYLIPILIVCLWTIIFII